MLDKSIFDRMDAIVAEVGPDPRAIADKIGARVTDAYGTVNGMIAHVCKHHRIAVNPNQPEYQYTFCFLHEDCHGIEEHYKLPGFINTLGFHADTDTFSAEFSKRMISYTEKICNLNAAKHMFNGEKILQMSGYFAFEKIREARKELWQAQLHLQQLQESLRYNDSSMMKYKYAEAKRELRDGYEKLMDLGSECSYSDFMTIEQIAKAHGVPEHYIVYAIEVQRILGADIDPQELRSFEKMFTKDRSVAGLDW